MPSLYVNSRIWMVSSEKTKFIVSSFIFVERRALDICEELRELVPVSLNYSSGVMTEFLSSSFNGAGKTKTITNKSIGIIIQQTTLLNFGTF